MVEFIELVSNWKGKCIEKIKHEICIFFLYNTILIAYSFYYFINIY